MSIANIAISKPRRGKRLHDKFRVNNDTEYLSVLMTLGEKNAIKKVQKSQKSKRSFFPTDSLLSLGIGKEHVKNTTKRGKVEKESVDEKNAKARANVVSKRSREQMSKLTQANGRDGCVQDNSLEETKKASTGAPLRNSSCIGTGVSKRARKLLDKSSKKPMEKEGTRLSRQKFKANEPRKAISAGTSRSEDSEVPQEHNKDGGLPESSGTTKNGDTLRATDELVGKEIVVLPLNPSKYSVDNTEDNGKCRRSKKSAGKRSNGARRKPTKISKGNNSNAAASIPEIPNAEQTSTEETPKEVKFLNKDLPKADGAPRARESNTPKVYASRRRRSPRLASKEADSEIIEKPGEAKKACVLPLGSNNQAQNCDFPPNQSSVGEAGVLCTSMPSTKATVVEKAPVSDSTKKKAESKVRTPNAYNDTNLSFRRVSFGDVRAISNEVQVSEGPTPSSLQRAQKDSTCLEATGNSPKDLQTPRRSARKVRPPSRFHESSESSKEEKAPRIQSAQSATKVGFKTSPCATAEGEVKGERNADRMGRSVRRSGRIINHPSRFGSYESGGSQCEEGTSVSTSRKNQKLGKSASRNEQKATNESKSEDKESHVVDDNGEDNERPWRESDVVLLREAQNEVNPTSFSFWEEVSELIGNRSAVECREKWFSLVKTPKVKESKAKKNLQQKVAMTPNDDIFNATPMKALFSQRSDGFDQGFGNLGFLENLNLGSAVKVNRAPTADGGPSMPTQRGYKTYITNMKRNILKMDNKRRLPVMTNMKSKVSKNVRERAEEGDVELNGRLSPGGTIHVKASGNEDFDDEYLNMSTEEDEADLLDGFC